MMPPASSLPIAQMRAQAEAVSQHLPGLILSAERLAALVAPGAHGLRRAGAGEDFWQYRLAAQGDTAAVIDWRRSARSDAQFVRDREAQSAQSAAIWVSRGQGMSFSGAADRPTKAARARLLALALAMVLLRGGERVGLLGQPLRAGRFQVEQVAEGLLSGSGHADDDQPPPEALRPHQRVVLIGDFLGDHDWLAVFLARAASLGVRGALMQVLDPDEETFPYAGSVVFRSMTGASRHHSRDAAALRADYLQRLAGRRDWLAAQAAGADWHFGHHRTDHAPAVALEWLYRVLEG